jgi:roadblock/LC7 domain-containing protein
LEEQAKSQAKMNADLNFKDFDKIKSKFPWAVGYIAVALENDLFSETETMIDPEKPMTRLDATVLLVKAKKWDADAKAKNTVNLTFKDENQIPSGAVGYVAVAVEKGLIQGFDNNTFRPNEPVTRAQMAALFDRVGDYLPDQDKYNVSGTVQAVDTTNNVLTINRNGANTQLQLTPFASVYRNNSFSAVGSIQVGDTVKVSLYNNTGIFVEVTKLASTATPNPSPNYDITVDGKLASYKTDANGRVSEVTVTTTVQVGNVNTTELRTYAVDSNFALTPSGAQLQNYYEKNVQLKVSIRVANNQVTYAITSVEFK